MDQLVYLDVTRLRQLGLELVNYCNYFVQNINICLNIHVNWLQNQQSDFLIVTSLRNGKTYLLKHFSIEWSSLVFYSSTVILVLCVDI